MADAQVADFCTLVLRREHGAVDNFFFVALSAGK